MVAQLGVSRMSAYRMARTLQDTGHLVHDSAVGGYRLGPAMLAGIYLAEGFAQLVTVARPYLESLVKETGELAAVAVELDGVAVCADLVASSRPFVPMIAVGRVIGDTANAHGKMFAAMKSDSERVRIAKRPHRRLTAWTITDPAGALSRAGQDQARRLGLRLGRARPRHLRRRRAGARSGRRRHRDDGSRGAGRPLRSGGEIDLCRGSESHGGLSLRVLGVRRRRHGPRLASRQSTTSSSDRSVQRPRRATRQGPRPACGGLNRVFGRGGPPRLMQFAQLSLSICDIAVSCFSISPPVLSRVGQETAQKREGART